MSNFHPETYLGLSYTWQLDMLIHGGYYVLLTLLLRYFVFKHSNLFLFAGILFLCSIVLEVLQAWIPKRSLTLLDMLSNFIGIVLGIVVFRFLETQITKEHSNQIVNLSGPKHRNL